MDNRLEVKLGATLSVEDAARAAKLEVIDTWITAKVKSTLIYSSNVNGPFEGPKRRSSVSL
ncbi:MAG: hypothetical protein JJE39_11250 [Vicinamibacteria bacterium]|nr:hypothetical protein [Vicinamibacteria bacterium]